MVRAGLMGPSAGLGDLTIVGAFFIPILLGIALGSLRAAPSSTHCSMLGFQTPLCNFWHEKFELFNLQGYSLGLSAVEALKLVLESGGSP